MFSSKDVDKMFQGMKDGRLPYKIVRFIGQRGVAIDFKNGLIMGCV